MRIAAGRGTQTFASDQRKKIFNLPPATMCRHAGFEHRKEVGSGASLISQVL